MRSFAFCLCATLLSASLAIAQTSAQKTIALTFDDVPFASLNSNASGAQVMAARQNTRRILETLARHHAPAIGFVNEGKLNNPGHRDEAAAILDDWLKAGHQLGNHGYSHPAFNSLTLQAFEEDFIRGEVITAPRMKHYGKQEHYYRNPFLDAGNTKEKWAGFEAFLKAHGYTDAPVTYQDMDWLYSAIYERASGELSSKAIPADKELAAKLRAEYVAEAERQLVFSEALNQRCCGRQIPLVSLMHADLLNAEVLDDVLTMLEKHSYRFVSIDEAMADPIYSTQDAFVGSDGLLWQLRWMPTLGKRQDFSGNPALPDWVDALWKKIQ